MQARRQSKAYRYPYRARVTRVGLTPVADHGQRPRGLRPSRRGILRSHDTTTRGRGYTCRHTHGLDDVWSARNAGRVFTEAAALTPPEAPAEADVADPAPQVHTLSSLCTPDSPFFTLTRIGSSGSGGVDADTPDAAQRGTAPADGLDTWDFLNAYATALTPPSPIVPSTAPGLGMTDTAHDTTDTARSTDPAGPRHPFHLPATTWWVALKRAVADFTRDGCADMAAALTYYGVLAVFPALIAVTSLLGLFGQGRTTIDGVMAQLTSTGLVPAEASAAMRATVESVLTTPAAGAMLVFGLLGAMWSASGYVGAFGRAMNVIFQQPEGRGLIRLRGQQLAVTAGVLVLAALLTIGLVVSGPVAETVGSWVGLSGVAVQVWGIAKVPVMIGLMGLLVAVLYHFTPNVRLTSWRWSSIGAAVAVTLWTVASIGFGVYVANFGNYNRTYGSLAGVIVFLLWMWIGNCALLLGAQIDAELERGRQLHVGIAAEETLQLPARDSSGAVKAARKREALLDEARQIRLDADVPHGEQRESSTRQP